MKCVCKHSDLQMFGFKLNKVWVIFIHLKSWVVVAIHNFMWVKKNGLRIKTSILSKTFFNVFYLRYMIEWCVYDTRVAEGLNKPTLDECWVNVAGIHYYLHIKLHHLNPLTAILFNLNFHLLEVVSRWRDPQLQVSENYSDLTRWRSTVFKYCWLMSHFIFTMLKRWYLMCY